MADHRASLHANNETHPWDEMEPHQVLALLPYELYGPVSTLGSQLDRLASGSFYDDELVDILNAMRDATNHLGRLVVALKRYTADTTAQEQLSPGPPQPQDTDSAVDG